LKAGVPMNMKVGLRLIVQPQAYSLKRRLSRL